MVAVNLDKLTGPTYDLRFKSRSGSIKVELDIQCIGTPLRGVLK